MNISLISQIDLEEVFKVDKHEYRMLKKRGRSVCLISALRKLFLYKIVLPPKKKANFLFFRSLVRKDYKRLFTSIHRAVRNKDKIIVEDYLQESYFAIFIGLVAIFNNLPKFSKVKSHEFNERIYLYLRLCFYQRVLSSLKKFEFNHVIFFADMQPIENYLSQYYNKTKTTITLQHGLYVEYETYSTVNTANYICQPSQIFLAWGEDTKNLIKKYHPEREIIICGKPHIYGIDTSKIIKSQESGIISVILDQNIFEQENKNLLSIGYNLAITLKMKLNVRFHPYNRKSKYRSLGYEFVEDAEIEASQYVIGHTSSLLYELYAAGMKVYKYKTNIPCVKFPDELSFNSLNGLLDIINSNKSVKNYGAHYINCTGKNSISLYKKFFNSLSKL